MKEGLCGDDSAHAVANEDDADARVNGRRGSAGGDLEVNDNVLKPARRISTLGGRMPAVLEADHSRNLVTQSPRSPRVSN